MGVTFLFHLVFSPLWMFFSPLLFLDVMMIFATHVDVPVTS